MGDEAQYQLYKNATLAEGGNSTGHTGARAFFVESIKPHSRRGFEGVQLGCMRGRLAPVEDLAHTSSLSWRHNITPRSGTEN